MLFSFAHLNKILNYHEHKTVHRYVRRLTVIAHSNLTVTVSTLGTFVITE